MNKTEAYLAFDKKHIWHPYTSMTDPMGTYMVERAEGVHIHLADGRVLTDGMSSWWAAIHGYNHPSLNRALNEQLQNMSHVMFGGLTHEPACTLAEKLISIVPKGLEHIFFRIPGPLRLRWPLRWPFSTSMPWENLEKRSCSPLRRAITAIPLPP